MYIFMWKKWIVTSLSVYIFIFFDLQVLSNEKLFSEKLKRNCSECHNESNREGDFDVTVFEDVQSYYIHYDGLKNIYQHVKSGDMPPENEVNISDSDKKFILNYLQETFHKLESSDSQITGPTRIRRLTSVEYDNTVRNITGLKLTLSKNFPKDGGGSEGFNNDSTVLGISPLLFEKYIEAAELVSTYSHFSNERGFFFTKDRKLKEAHLRNIDLKRSKIKPHIYTLLYKAYRMPPTQKILMKMTDDFISDAKRFGIKVSTQIFITRVFSNLKFLYRYEQKTGAPAKITNYELASRLSYFLWSHPPDEELLKLAEQGELNKPDILNSQVMRMLKDKKSFALARDFASQWLQFSQILESEGPSKKIFKNFDSKLAKDMWLESAHFFDYIVKQNRSVLEIIDSDYSFLNGKLRELYGLGKGNSKFSKVIFNNRRRGGITTHASILTVTSNPLRTSPIHRGTWIMSALLGTPAPPPPDDVPSLPDEETVSKELPLKKQYEAHRKSSECKSCHLKIDPLGFPLENYDVVGRWRDKYEKAPIDSIGELASGKKINGPEGLKKYLLKEKESFLKNISRKLLGYALGRSIKYYDFYIINRMVSELKDNDYRFAVMIFQIVNSYQFQYKN